MPIISHYNDCDFIGKGTYKQKRCKIKRLWSNPVTHHERNSLV